MTIEQKFLLTTVVLVCAILISLVMYGAKRQEAKSLKKDYDELRGKYSHLEASANLVGKIKQSEGMKTTFEADVTIGDEIYSKEYSKNGEVMVGKVVTVCWFGTDNYTFIVFFREGGVTLEFPESALGETAFFTEEGAASAEQKRTYDDLGKDSYKETN